MPGVSERARSAPSNNCGGVFAGHLNERDKARMTFHQSGDVTVVGAADQIALPMTGDGAVFDLSRPFSNGDSVDDLTAVISAITGTAGDILAAWFAGARSALSSALHGLNE